MPTTMLPLAGQTQDQGIGLPTLGLMPTLDAVKSFVVTVQRIGDSGHDNWINQIIREQEEQFHRVLKQVIPVQTFADYGPQSDASVANGFERHSPPHTGGFMLVFGKDD